MPESSQIGDSPRYPGLRISVESDSPLVLVAAVRQELRRAGVPRAEIQAFSDRALSTGLDSKVVRRAVEEWVGGQE